MKIDQKYNLEKESEHPEFYVREEWIMIKKEDIITKLDQAKKSYADACERGNGLVAEYYEGVIDTLSDIIDSLGTKDE